MNDLISRSAAMEIFNSACKAEFYPPDIYPYVRAIEDLPAVDAVPVVRCKDCYLFIPYTEAHRKASGFDGDCAFLAGYADCGRECVHEMDFCSKGARMDCGERRGQNGSE